MIPQMSPMNWLMLFIYFNVCFFICMNKIFYLSLMKVNKINTNEVSCTSYSYMI